MAQAGTDVSQFDTHLALVVTDMAHGVTARKLQRNLCASLQSLANFAVKNLNTKTNGNKMVVTGSKMVVNGTKINLS